MHVKIYIKYCNSYFVILVVVLIVLYIERDFVNILLSVTIKQRTTKEKIEADNTWNAIETVFEGVNEQGLAN